MPSRIAPLAYLAAILIAAAIPARAQTLPFYDSDALMAKCIVDAPKQESAEQCKLVLILEKGARTELAKHWESYDHSIRLQCIASKSVVDFIGLLDCIDRMKKRRPYLPGRW